MAIPNSQVVRFTPRGLTDAYDATDKFPGACRQLTNFIFDQGNPELVVARPGVQLLVDLKLAGYGFANFISVHIGVGSRVYGMVGNNGPGVALNGHDQPFCYDTATGLVVPISNQTAANTPISPATVGDWQPPSMAVIGTMVIVTHPGYNNLPKNLWGTFAQGGSNLQWGDATTTPTGSGAIWGDRYTFGVIDISDPAAPTWNSTTTAINPLTGPPQWVVNFSNRAWFAVGNLLEYTDVLTNPLTVTNATQQVTVGDSDGIVAMAGLPVQTTGSGILQTMTVLKKTQVWQLGGDPATWNLSLSYTSLTVGTNAPRSLAQSPYGLYFSSSGGVYFIDLLGTLRAVTHSLNELEPDLQSPFAGAATPSRWCAGYNSTVYRVAGVGSFLGIQTYGDYWFDERKRRWTGPHSFFYDCVSPVRGDFIVSSAFVPGCLLVSASQQNANFTPDDLGTLQTCTLLTATLPKLDWMSVKQVVESQIELASGSGDITYRITAQDEQGRRLGNVNLVVHTGGALWSTFDWGDGTEWGTSQLWGAGSAWGAIAQQWGFGEAWGNFNNFWTDVGGSNLRWGLGAQNIPSTYPLQWTAPLVFEKMQLRVDVSSSTNAGIGTFYARTQKTGYMTFGPGRH